MTTYIQIPVEGGGSDYWIDAVANFAALPTPGPVDGAVALTLDTNLIWRWDAGTVAWVAASSSASGFVGGFAVVSTAGGLAESLVTTTELGYVAGVTSAIQTQLNAKLALAGGTMTGALVLAGAPVGANDAVTLAYLQSTVEGFSPKLPVLVSTTANIALTGEQTLDGVLTSASRVLVRFQTAPAENGIYVSAAGAWARSADMNAWSEVPSAFVIVETGTVYGDTGWLCTSNPGGTLGTTAITWGQWFGVGTYTADGTYVALTGSQFSLSAAAATSINDVQAATDANTASTLVKRDASGNFAAGTITTPEVAGVAGAGTNIAGGDHTVSGGTSTGNAAGGSIIFRASPAGASGAGVNALSDQMRILSTGRVGIGTATPASKFDVSGSISAGSYAGASAAPTNGMIISGLVGIGTASPLADLHVSDDAAVTTAMTGVLHTISNTSSTASIAKVGLNVQSTGTWNGASATNTGLNVNATGGTTNYAAIFSGGNVGIGTTAPTSLLHVATTTTGNFAIAQLFASSNTVGGNATTLKVGVNNSSKNCGEIYFSYAGSGSNSNTFNFGLSGALVMTMNGAGNVGIGTTNPGSKVQINGSAAIGYPSSTAAPTNGLAVSGNVGIGNSSPTNTLDVTGGVTATSAKFGATGTVIASAALEVSSTTKAFYPPRMTTAQRTAISAANGAMVYNTDTDRFEGYVAGAWTALHGWGT